MFSLNYLTLKQAQKKGFNDFKTNWLVVLKSFQKKSEKKFRSKFLTLEIERGENRKPDQFYFEKRFQKMDVVGWSIFVV